MDFESFIKSIFAPKKEVEKVCVKRLNQHEIEQVKNIDEQLSVIHKLESELMARKQIVNSQIVIFFETIKLENGLHNKEFYVNRDSWCIFKDLE